jgi:hypothetical protein
MAWDLVTKDGITIKNIPDDVPQDSPKLQARVSAIRQVSTDSITQGALDPTQGMSGIEKFNAGMGKAFADVGRGAAQLVGAGPSADDVRETRRLDAPLMKTGAGLSGNIAGNIAMMAPASVLPGASAVPAAGAIGATLAALQPTETSGERLKNMGVGFGLGSGSQWAGTTGATLLGERAVANKTAAAVQQAQNAERDAALTAGRERGYVVPPSTIKPTLANTAIESVGGKVAVQQQASVKNQTVSDTLGREALGLRPDAPLTESSLAQMRKNAGQAYEAVKNAQAVGGKIVHDPQFQQEARGIGSSFTQAAKDFPESTRNTAIEALNKDLSIGSWTPTGVIEKIKMLRADASANFKAFNDPEKLALARAQRQAADALDGLVERNLAQSGEMSLAEDYHAARTLISKIHDIESALTPGGHIDARVIAKIGDSKNLSGPLKTIADFAGNFQKAVQTGEKVGSPMVHAIRPTVGGAAGAMIGGPVGAAVGAGAGVAVPWAARGAMLSGPGQSVMATPSYSAGLLSRAADAGMLPSPQTAGLLSRTAIPAIYSGMAQ